MGTRGYIYRRGLGEHLMEEVTLNSEGLGAEISGFLKSGGRPFILVEGTE